MPDGTFGYAPGEKPRPFAGLTRIAAQLGGGVVGWRLLLAAGAYMPGDVGGPAPDARLPLYYVFLSECLGGAALCGAVWAFATTKMGDVYVRKMALINCTLRTVILAFGATGPAVNPALAFSYVFATEGAWPTLENHWPSYVARARPRPRRLGARDPRPLGRPRRRRRRRRLAAAPAPTPSSRRGAGADADADAAASAGTGSAA